MTSPRGQPRSVPAVRIPLGFPAISKTCWRREGDQDQTFSRAKSMISDMTNGPVSCLTGKIQGNFATLINLVEFSAESVRKFSRLVMNSLRIGTGNIFSRTGVFLAITGKRICGLGNVSTALRQVQIPGPQPPEPTDRYSCFVLKKHRPSVRFGGMIR